MTKGWTIYVTNSGDGVEYFTNLRAAEKAARALLAEGYGDVDIERHECVPMNLINFLDVLDTSGGSWSAGHEIIKTLRSK